MGFIVTRTLPATYVYGIYRHAHSARHVRVWDLSSRTLCPPRTSTGFRITREAIGVLLRDLESSFRRLLPWQRDLYYMKLAGVS